MPHYPTSQEIEQLRIEVDERISRENMAYSRWQEELEEKYKRRVDEVIIEVVRDFYHRVFMPAVAELRKLFLLD